MIYYTERGDEVEVADVLETMTEGEVVQLVRDLLEGGYIPEGWCREYEPTLATPSLRLAVITALRAEGYTVEPA